MPGENPFRYGIPDNDDASVYDRTAEGFSPGFGLVLEKKNKIVRLCMILIVMTIIRAKN